MEPTHRAGKDSREPNKLFLRSIGEGFSLFSSMPKSMEEAMKSEEPNQFGEHQIQDEIRAAEKKAVECSIRLERAELKFGLEFGRAMVALRDKKKAAGERDWMAYLDRLGISYEKANRWMNKVEGKETRHGKKAETPRAESQNAQPPKSTLASWERIAGELKVVVDHAVILQNSQPVSEPSRTQLAVLAKRVLELTGGGDNA
jgi:hypothetical protein